MSDTPTRLDTYLAAQRIQDEFYGFSADEIERMPMDVYQRLRARAGLSDVDPYSDAYAAYEPPGTPTTISAPDAAQANADAVQGQPRGITDEEFLAWRAGRVSGGEGVGIMNQQGGTDAWVAAARAKSGRTGMNKSNVQRAAQIDGSKYLTPNEPVTGRANFYR